MTALPKKYQWLLKVDELPKVVSEGIKLLGTVETIGSANNPIIMGWAKALKVDNIYKADSTAWCGLAHAYVLTRAGKYVPLKSWDLLRALKYKAFGVHVLKENAALGDTLIFERKGGGHVGTYIAESATTYHVQGGNQSDSFSIVEIEKERCVAVRRPIYQNMPKGVRKYFMDTSGNVSTNEA